MARMKINVLLALSALAVLSACASDSAVQQTASEAKPGECIRRTGSNVCAKYYDKADGVIDAGTKDLESIRQAPAGMTMQGR